MGQDVLRYDRMVQDALRDVVRRALTEVAAAGFPGQHHFYVTFKTGFPGVELPDHLRATYPDEMTIVLQHQFYGLEVDEVGFVVTLSFNKNLERLRIPLAAVTAFVDPSVNFGLQFQVELAVPEALRTMPGVPAAVDAPEAAVEPVPAGSELAGQPKIISLDAFRKK